ncbi:MAG: hypothetical protein AB7R69_03205 [Candidatus Babeliales bacterium]
MKKILILVLGGLMLTQGINAAEQRRAAQQQTFSQIKEELTNLDVTNFEELEDWFKDNVANQFPKGSVQRRALDRLYKQKEKELENKYPNFWEFKN